MRVLVVGGTGFVGSHAVRRLAARGHDLTLLHRGQTETELPAGVRHLRGDRAALGDLAAEVRQFAPDVVLHTVAMTQAHAREAVRAFRGLAGRLVVLSSSDVYRARDRLFGIEPGEPDPVPLGEDAPLREVYYPYRAHAPAPDHWIHDYDKLLVEPAVLAEPELPAVVLRLPAVYGPGDPQRRFHEYVKRVDDGRRAILLGAGRAGWRWTRGYVEDVATAAALAVERPDASGRVYNVGEPDAPTEAEWARLVGRAAGWKGEVVVVPDDRLPAHLQMPLDWRQDLVVDSSRIRAELEYREALPREEAVRRTVAWERAYPPADPPAGARFDYDAEDAAIAALDAGPRGR